MKVNELGTWSTGDPDQTPDSPLFRLSESVKSEDNRNLHPSTSLEYQQGTRSGQGTQLPGGQFFLLIGWPTMLFFNLEPDIFGNYLSNRNTICFTLSRVVCCVVLVFPVVNTLVYGDGLAGHDRRREITEYSLWWMLSCWNDKDEMFPHSLLSYSILSLVQTI